jgi:3-deoxy-D-manno-octulosonic-acid transferase
MWIHSISVGETLLALKLARELLAADPALRIALSVTTTTGFAQARGAESERLKAIYNPVDLPVIVKRSLAIVRPERLVFIEAMWPNLVALAFEAGIPVTMVPRLSPRSEGRFRRAGWLTTPIFRLIHRFFVQDQRDAKRWLSLGVRSDQIEVTGNIKFDQPTGDAPRIEPLRAVLKACAVDEWRPVLLGGSTFPGEEAVLGRVLLALKTRFPDLFLIVVPRHVERSKEAEANLASLGLRVARRSNPTAHPDCLLVDSTGELRDWYHLSTVVFVGKSLEAIGGQNPVEPAIAGKPVIYGPHMENFQAVVDAWRAGEAAIEVSGESELTEAVAGLLSEPERRKQLVERTRDFIQMHAGATARIAQGIVQI